MFDYGLIVISQVLATAETDKTGFGRPLLTVTLCAFAPSSAEG